MVDANNYKIKIKVLALFVRNVQLSPAVRMGHVKAFEKTSCKYPIRRVEVKVDTVPRGNMNYVQDNMFLGQLPKRLVIGCVDSDVNFGHEQWYILYYYYSKKKRRGCTSGHAQSIPQVMTSLPVT
jgi:hypothetical protein